MNERLSSIEKNDYMWKLEIGMLLDLLAEDLNNEDTLGNVTKSRMIKINEEEVRNAISGNMLSHIFSKNLRALSDTNELCDTCKIFSPMKNGKIKEIDKSLSDSGNKVKNCIIDDICGFMNAGKGNNEKRSKVLNFAWAISKNGTCDTVLYNRVDPTDKNSKTKSEQEIIKDEDGKEIKDTTSEANTNKSQNAQMIFYRPIRSSEYAIITQINLSRVAFDDQKQKYVFEDKEIIKSRIKKLLIAYMNTILDIEGAMCSTNMPHLKGVSGVLIEKTSAKQLMSKYSPLNEDYKKVHLNIDLNDEKSTNKLELNNISLAEGREFNNVQEFIKTIDYILDDEYLDFMIERNMKYVKETFKENK